MHRDFRVTGCEFEHATQHYRCLAEVDSHCPDPHEYRLRDIAFLLLIFVILLTTSSPALAQDTPAPAASESLDDQLLKTVLDVQADPTLRRDAATTLFDRGGTAAIALLMNELKITKDPACRKAIVLGLRSCKKPPADIDTILLDLAGELEASLHQEVGEVVGRCASPQRIKTLLDLGLSARTPASTRQIAILALGHIRTQEAAGSLVSILQSTETDQGIRHLTGTSLARLSGLDGHGDETARWTAWWSTTKALTEVQWQGHLLENFTKRAQALTSERAILNDRLLTAMRQRYRAVTKEERETILISMLADPLDSVRGLALDLVRELVNTEHVSPELSKALMTRLNDNKTSIRTGAALILRDLKIDEAADIVATRLADELEHDKSVLKAYLLVMTRQPRLAAMGPAIALLSDIDVRSEAAGAILAGFDNQPSLIGREQSQRIAVLLRTSFAAERSPEPRFIELLGRVGNRQDFQKIRGWLDHPSDPVREAAARAWVATNLSLEPLAQRAGDPIIQVIVIPAATLRGADS